MLPLRVWVGLGVMVMKEYSTFVKTPGLGLHHQIQFNVLTQTLEGGVLLLCRDAVCVFYCPSRSISNNSNWFWEKERQATSQEQNKLEKLTDTRYQLTVQRIKSRTPEMLWLSQRILWPVVRLSSHRRKLTKPPRFKFCTKLSTVISFENICIQPVSNIVVAGALTRCALLYTVRYLIVVQMNVQRSLIRELRLFEFELNHHHHHHIVLVAQISLTLSRHSSLSFIALGRSSGQHPVSSHSCWMYVRAGRPAFARPCVGTQKQPKGAVDYCTVTR